MTIFRSHVISDSLTGGDCDYELGMQSKDIPDANITASSKLSSNHSPALARVDKKGAWCSAPNDNSPYLQIQLGKKKSITKITTQGSFEYLRWARKYQIKYFKDGKWVTYQKSDGTEVSVKLPVKKSRPRFSAFCPFREGPYYSRVF